MTDINLDTHLKKSP